ncbi:hypothetical protein D3C79_916540 [compost metagenome]
MAGHADRRGLYQAIAVCQCPGHVFRHADPLFAKVPRQLPLQAVAACRIPIVQYQMTDAVRQ